MPWYEMPWYGVPGEVLRERHGHAADAAADVEHPVFTAQATDLDEVAQEFRADRPEVAVADEDAAGGRLGEETVGLDGAQEQFQRGFLGDGGGQDGSVHAAASARSAKARWARSGSDVAGSASMASSQRCWCSQPLYRQATPRM